MELNSNLRHMPEIQNIAAYLREMTFRHKAFGGCDEESVLDHISNVTLQYEAVLSMLLTRGDQAARQVAALQSALAQAEQDGTVLVEWHEQLNARLQAENAQLRRQLAAAQAELDQTRLALAEAVAPGPSWYAMAEPVWQYAG